MIDTIKFWFASEKDKYMGLWAATPATLKTAIFVALGVAAFIGLGLGSLK